MKAHPLFLLLAVALILAEVSARPPEDASTALGIPSSSAEDNDVGTEEASAKAIIGSNHGSRNASRNASKGFSTGHRIPLELFSQNTLKRIELISGDPDEALTAPRLDS